MRRRDVRTAARRVAIARVLLVLPFVLLGARAAHLSVIDERGEQLGLAQSRRVLALAPERGTIFDRSGVELALTMDAPSVYAIPSQIEKADATAKALARALGTTQRRVAERLRGRSSFTFVARWVGADRAEKVRALELDGVGVIEEPRRTYPHRALAAPIVGFANIDGVGVRGVEQQEDGWLRGTARKLPVERDARGRLLVFEGDERWSTSGGDIALTLDANLQAQARTALLEAIERTGARGGVVLSMDPGTGDILALAEAPGFDPNSFRDVDYRATRSRAFLDAADPGSTLKAFLVAAALEKRAIETDDTFDCSGGSVDVPGKTIRDRRPLGVLDARGVLRLSSNVGAVMIARELGAADHFEMLRDFGFGESTRSGFPDESAGLLRPWKSWKPLDQAAIAFGQGVSVTPVQLAAATATIANGGRWVRPRLVMARRAARTPWRVANAPTGRQVLSPATAATVLGMLETVVSADGTGRRASLEGVRVAGKTGTAQKLDRETGTYSEERYVAWFVGVVPADDPALVIVAGLDEPDRPTHTGGSAAAPLFARVAAAQLAEFGILTAPSVEGRETRSAPSEELRVARLPDAPEAASALESRPASSTPSEPRTRSAKVAESPPVDAAKEETRTEALEVDSEERAADVQAAETGVRMLVPDFVGHTDVEVERLGAILGVGVDVGGRGRAVAQDPPAGTVVPHGGAPVRVRCEPEGGAI